NVNAGTLEHDGASNNREVLDRINCGHRLQPGWHRLDRSSRTGKNRQRRIGEETHQFCACCCVRVKVAIIIPIPMPQITHSEADRKNNKRLPRIGTPKTSRATLSARPISIASRRKIGATFAMINSQLLAGVINNCSIVPISFSRTSEAEDTTDPCSTKRSPITPVVMNQALLRPGL